jgi:ACGX-repeat protein
LNVTLKIAYNIARRNIYVDRLQKGDRVIKMYLSYRKVRTFASRSSSVIFTVQEAMVPAEITYTEDVDIMALKNLFIWNKNAAQSSACGTACGASDKPAEQPTACGAAAPVETPAACGAADKPAETPAACGAAAPVETPAACGAADKPASACGSSDQ